MATGLQLAHNGVLAEALKQGFQSFVPQYPTAAYAPSLTATTTTGTPASGKFYSTITNRAAIPDITQDLKALMGVERILTQQPFEIQTEFGPNGEKVYGAVNDDRGLIRFVGNWQSNQAAGAATTSGFATYATTSSDYVEVTFFGTALNMLLLPLSGTVTYQVSVDGAAETPVSITAGLVINARNYATNQILQITSGLSLGVHTVKIRCNISASFYFYGVEIINESSSIKVNPGSAYIDLNKTTLSAQQSLAYNSTFESGSLSTRGGRVLLYLKQDRTIAKAVTPTDSTSKTLTNADHTNEEIARVYHWREFGANRSDDFSTLVGSLSSRAFTLDDGTTSLVGSSVYMHTADASLAPFSNGSFITFTFVGTGLDVQVADNANGGSDSYNFQIDGGSTVAWPNTAGNTNPRTIKIVSGLPYGTHTFRFNRVTATSWEPGFRNFIVYQPKKPSLPTGAIELADYNIMADYSASASSAIGQVASGVLRKMLSSREATYAGTWSIAGVNTTLFESGINTNTTTSTSTATYYFFGTGFEFKGYIGGGVAANITVAVDGSSNLSGYTTSLAQTSTGTAFTASTGAITGTAAAGNNIRLQVSGLSLGLHKVVFTQNNTNQFNVDSFDIITPIHSHKSNLYYDAQNSLPVGSCSLSDNRAITLVKDTNLQKKNIAQATGITANPTTTSTSLVPMPDMSVVHKNATGRIEISYSVLQLNNTASGLVYNAIYIDGVQVGTDRRYQAFTGSAQGTQCDSIVVNVSPGVHKIDIYWKVNTGTATALDTSRNLTVQEL